MLHIERDRNGNIAGLYKWPNERAPEILPEHHPEVEAFLNRPAPQAITPAEVVEALDEIAAAVPAESRTKLDALKARMVKA